MDLNKLVNESLAKIEQDGFVQKAVEKQLKSTIEEIVIDLFRSYSDFGKNLKKKVQSELSVNLEDLNLGGYNIMVLNAVKEKLDEAITIQGIEKMKKSLDDLLGDTKDEYKLSELIEEMKNEAQGNSDDYDEGDEISFHINPDRRILTHIYFDEKSDVREYSCKYRIWVGDDKKVSGIEIKGTKFDNRTIMGGLHGLEATLFKIYSSGATLIIDEDDVELEYKYVDGDDD